MNDPYPKTWFQLYDEERQKNTTLKNKTQKLVEGWRRKAAKGNHPTNREIGWEQCADDLAAILESVITTGGDDRFWPLLLSIPDYNALLKLSKFSGETIDDLVQAALNLGVRDNTQDRDGESRLISCAVGVRLSHPAQTAPDEPKSRW